LYGLTETKRTLHLLYLPLVELEDFLMPQTIIFCDALPQTPSGKIKKFAK
jgi:acyl-coenzyme A synthetase/AMP-(fatty) acid ligase